MLTLLTVVTILTFSIVAPILILGFWSAASDLSRGRESISYRKAKIGYFLYTKCSFRYSDPHYTLVSWAPDKNLLFYMIAKLISMSEKKSSKQMVDVEVTIIKQQAENSITT